MPEELSFYERTGFKDFEELYSSQHQRIFRYVQARINEKENVDDIVQQAFLNFIEKESFISNSRQNPKIGTETFLISLAKYRTMDYLRDYYRRKRKKELEKKAISDWSINGGEIDNDTEFGSKEKPKSEEELKQKIKEILPKSYW